MIGTVQRAGRIENRTSFEDLTTSTVNPPS